LPFSDTEFFYRNEEGDALFFDVTTKSSVIILPAEFLVRIVKVCNKYVRLILYKD
jgi:hypothetical protein